MASDAGHRLRGHSPPTAAGAGPRPHGRSLPLTTRAATSLHILGLTVRVESTDPEDLRWLEDFLSPSFEIVDAPAHDVLVSYETDTGRHADFLKTGTTGPAIACFVLDRETVAHPLVASHPTERIVYDREFDLFYRARRDPPQVLILAAEGNPAARVGLMRVVRELAMGHLQRLEGVVVHAAALELAGRAMIIAGPKRSGKTTLLTALLQEAGVQYLANDRVLLRPENSRALVRGLPTLVSLRAGTLATFPQLRHRLALRPARSTEQTPKSVMSPAGLGARSLSPQQFCEAVGVGRASETTCAVLLFPQLRPERSGLELVPLSPHAAADRLLDLLLPRGAGDGRAAFDLGSEAAPRPGTADKTMCRGLAGRVRSFDCRLGPDAYRGSPGVALLLDELRA